LNKCAGLKKKNNEIRQQSSSHRSNGQQQQQMELLRQMVRGSEEALNKERTKTSTKKTDDYRALNDQVYFT
jgi:erythromycin esterase-like protein